MAAARGAKAARGPMAAARGAARGPMAAARGAEADPAEEVGAGGAGEGATAEVPGSAEVVGGDAAAAAAAGEEK